MPLEKYRKMRHFDETPEPSGAEQVKPAEQLRFVVQKHLASHLHYDFRLELDGVLLSWAVPKGPSLDPSVKRLAMMTEDHPLDYMHFEGTIPRGHYGAGEVIVWDLGVYHSAETLDHKKNKEILRAGLKKGHLDFVLVGEKLKGRFALIETKRPGSKNAWLLVKHKDEYTSAEDPTADNSSVLSPRRLGSKKGEKIERLSSSKLPHSKPKSRDPMPHGIRPMLATLVDQPFDRKNWFFETKWDGYRAIAEVGKKIDLYSRKGNSFLEKYPPVVKALKKIKNKVVLDGEVIALKNGLSDFHTLQQYGEHPAPLQYVVFDILYLDGEDLRSRPLRERKALLKKILPEDSVLKYSTHIEEKGKNFFEESREKKLEGIIAKDAESSYETGRRSDKWLKVKNFYEQETIILGFTEPRGSRKILGSLVLGVYEDGELRFIGHSGGGFSHEELVSLFKKLKKITRKTSPIKEKVPINSPITWVEPKYVCQARFSEWTPDGRMRHPIYAGLREDKDPKDVVKEKPKEIGGIKKGSQKNMPKKRKFSDEPKLTNLDKVYWPEEGYTKGDLVRYYDRMADVILPYLIDRPESLLRHPNGIKGKSFFQKDITNEVPDFVETKKIFSESNSKYINYLLCQNKETLLYLANLGCIELNPWSARVQDMEKPDFLILDLDPGENTFQEVVEVALAVHEVLTLACEEHYIKTSGKTGLHIFVPLQARYDYDMIRQFSELLANLVHKKVPHITSLERSPAKRKDKIYIDYLQNRRGQTIAAPYSVRPWPGATVSTPLRWEEVKKGLDPAKFTIKTIEKRLKKYGDLWAPVIKKGVDLQASMVCLNKHAKKLGIS